MVKARSNHSKLLADFDFDAFLRNDEPTEIDETPNDMTQNPFRPPCNARIAEAPPTAGTPPSRGEPQGSSHTPRQSNKRSMPDRHEVDDLPAPRTVERFSPTAANPHGAQPLIKVRQDKERSAIVSEEHRKRPRISSQEVEVPPGRGTDSSSTPKHPQNPPPPEFDNRISHMQLMELMTEDQRKHIARRLHEGMEAPPVPPVPITTSGSPAHPRGPSILN